MRSQQRRNVIPIASLLISNPSRSVTEIKWHVKLSLRFGCINSESTIVGRLDIHVYKEADIEGVSNLGCD
jgi:hypothetical protein